MTWIDWAVIVLVCLALWGLLTYGQKRRGQKRLRRLQAAIEEYRQDTETEPRRAKLQKMPGNGKTQPGPYSEKSRGPKGFVDRYGVHHPDPWAVNSKEPR